MTILDAAEILSLVKNQWSLGSPTVTPADTMNWDQGDSLQVTVKVQVKQGA